MNPTSIVPSPSPRAYTAEEVRHMFYQKLDTIIRYWEGGAQAKHPSGVIPGINDTELARMEGVIFTLLAEMDGCGLPLCAMDITLQPHSGDKAYCIQQGENWFEPGMSIAYESLHDGWTAFKRAQRESAASRATP